MVGQVFWGSTAAYCVGLAYVTLSALAIGKGDGRGFFVLLFLFGGLALALVFFAVALALTWIAAEANLTLYVFLTPLVLMAIYGVAVLPLGFFHPLSTGFYLAAVLGAAYWFGAYGLRFSAFASGSS